MLPDALKTEAIAKYGRKFAFIYPVKEFTDFDRLSYSDEGTGKATGKYYAQCSECGGTFESVRPGNNLGSSPTDMEPDRQLIVCPHCGAMIEPRKGWYGRKGIKDRFYLQAWEVHSEQHVTLHECIIALDDLSSGDWKYETVYDLRRTELTPGRSETYKFSLEHGDKLLKLSGTAPPVEACGCTITFGYFKPMTHRGCYMGIEKLEDTFLRYYFRMLEADDSIASADYAAYIIRINEEPMLEFLFKMGYTGIVNERVLKYRANTGTRYLDFAAKSPKKFFRGIGKGNIGQKMKTVVDTVPSYRRDKLTVKDLESAVRRFRSFPSEKPEYAAALMDVRRFNVIWDCLPMYSSERVLNYLKQRKNTPPGYYADYLDAAKSCGAPLNEQQTAFPDDLAAAHDDMTAKRGYLFDRVTCEKMRKRHLELTAQGYTYRRGGVCAVIPEAPSEIVFEGKVLHHCVGQYARRAANGETNIIFIRHENSPESWLTLEVDPKSLHFIQCYGERNRVTGMFGRAAKYLPEVGKFLYYYKRHLERAAKRKEVIHGRKQGNQHGAA